MNGSMAAGTLPQQLADWRSFYQSEFGIALGNVDISAAFTGSERLIVVAQSLTADDVLAHCERYFRITFGMPRPVANNIRHEDRNSNRSYAITIPPHFKSKKSGSVPNADSFIAAGHRGMTLLERLLLELKHFVETGKHIEGASSSTLCTGTRMDADFIPSVGCGLPRKPRGITLQVQHSYSGLRGVMPWPVTVLT